GRRLHTREVAGSKPAAPISSCYDRRLKACRGSFAREAWALKKFGGSVCWTAIVLTLAATWFAPAVARATPTWLSAINLSDPGQDGFDPQVAEDSSGNSLMVWTRSDGTNLRIQAKFRDTN